MTNDSLASATQTEEVVAPVTAEETQEEAQENEQADSETQTTEEEGSEPEVKEQKVVRELKEQRRKRQEAERRNVAVTAEAAYWKGVAEGKGKSTGPANVVAETNEAPVPPKIDDFESIEAYDTAREEYLEKKLEWKLQSKREADIKANEEAVKLTEMQKIDSAFAERMEAAIDEDPELATIRDSVGRAITPNMGVAIKQSENAPDIIRYLNDNRKEIDRIKVLNPIAQVRELVKIENKIMNPTNTEAKNITQAPKPVKTVNASKGAIVSVDDEKLSTAEWMEKERQRIRDKNKR